MRALARLALGLALGVLLASADARPEADAPALHDDVVAAWHEPDRPPASSQFSVHLQLVPETNITDVRVQVCVIDMLTCIIPPSNATREGDVWSFDTATFRPDDPYAWPAGARIGAQWSLDGVLVPDGPDLSDPGCAGRQMDCFADKYLEFTMGAARNASGPVAVAALAIAAVALWRRHGQAQ